MPPAAHARHPFPAARLKAVGGSGLDITPGIRHPGTGHGAGRRTGSTPVASNAGPWPPALWLRPKFRGNPTPPRPIDCFGYGHVVGPWPPRRSDRRRLDVADGPLPGGGRRGRGGSVAQWALLAVDGVGEQLTEGLPFPEGTQVHGQ